MTEVDTNVSCIYKITNLVNNKIYVGSAVIFRKRRDLHLLELKRGKHHSRYLQNAYHKYGVGNFKFDIIEIIKANTKKQLKELLESREQFYLDNLKPDYNVCKRTDSRLGVKSSPEHIAKIVKANTGKKRTPEQKEKMKQLRLGKKFTDEQRLNLKNRPPVTEETKRKISNARKGFKHTEEAKAKMRAKAKLRKSKPFSEQHKLNLSNATKAHWNKIKENRCNHG